MELDEVGQEVICPCLTMLRSFLSLLFPQKCVRCGRLLLPGEEVLCLLCQSDLPRLYAGSRDNVVEHYLLGRIDCEHATSFVNYSAVSSALFKEAKYRNHPWINRRLAQLFATELKADGWPYDIDAMVPVPIHWRRRLTRGYNQAYHVALGLADRWGLEVVDGLRKHSYTSSQVGLSFQERLENVEGSFRVSHPERLAGRHILLVDDVLTSGATLEACSSELRRACPGIRISILTLAFAHV